MKHFQYKRNAPRWIKASDEIRVHPQRPMIRLSEKKTMAFSGQAFARLERSFFHVKDWNSGSLLCFCSNFFGISSIHNILAFFRNLTLLVILPAGAASVLDMFDSPATIFFLFLRLAPPAAFANCTSSISQIAFASIPFSGLICPTYCFKRLYSAVVRNQC